VWMKIKRCSNKGEKNEFSNNAATKRTGKKF
jgi:hypothetical protein